MQISTSGTGIAAAVGFLTGTESGLDTIYASLRRQSVAPALDDLFDDLNVWRDDEPESWAGVRRACLEHPIRRVLHQDPFTYRAFSKPRGYAGDAVMMDYIYGLGDARPAYDDATPMGRAIFAYMGTRPSARAVRYRRQLLASIIDDAVSRGGRAVFALAAGHLREAELSRAVQAGQVARFVAMDQDEASLAVVARDYARLGVQAVPGSVRRILARKDPLGQFDVVYAAGLYDYLAAPVAAALTSRLFDMTRPGGTLLVPNFRAGARDTGYMEAFMDWDLIYRDHDAMAALAAGLPSDAVHAFDIFDDEDRTITFLRVTKR